MKNHHESSELLDENHIKKLARLLDLAWGRDTCYPASRDAWSVANKALGQCAVTALVVNDLYGGTFAIDETHDHIWNILPDGSHQDFTRTQFQKPLTLTQTRTEVRKDLLEHKDAKQVEIAERYALLKGRILSICHEFGMILP